MIPVVVRVAFFGSLFLCFVASKPLDQQPSAAVEAEAVAADEDPFPDPPVIEFEEVKKGLEDQTLIVIDVRGREPVRKRGLIPGSFHIPFAKIEDAFVNLPSNDFSEIYGFNRPEKPGSNVVITCHKGRLSRNAILALNKHGYTELRWYKGGFLDWMQHNGTSVLTSTDSPTELEEVISSEAASADLTTDPVEGEGALENSSDSSTAVEENETPPSAAAAKDLTEFIKIEFSELRNELNSGKYAIFDVRPQKMLKSFGAIPGSCNVPFHDFESAFQSFSPPEFSEKYGCERPEKPGSNIVIYSNNRTSAQDAMAELHRFGYNEAIMYDGGLADWTTNGGSLQLSGSTEEKEPEVPVITSEDLKKGLDADALTLIDVRNETEIVADGKVPKSHNVPLPEIFEAFKLPEEEFVAKYGFKRPPPPGDDVVIMCRSGRRALNAIVLLRSLGYTNLILYADSFRGWTSRGYQFLHSGILESTSDYSTAGEEEKVSPVPLIAADQAETMRKKNENTAGNWMWNCNTVGPDGETLDKAVLRRGLGYEEFKKIYNERSSVVIDIRPAEEFYLDGIQDTVSLPAGEIEAASALSDEEFAAKYGFFKPQADWSDALILGVNGCDVLGTVHDIMKSGGIKVRWYIGGIEEWNERNPMTTDSSGITPNVIPDPQKA